MRIATYNIRVTKPEDILKGRAFLFRLPRILRNLKKVDADVIAFQEVQKLHIFCLRLFLRGYKIGYASFDGVDGGNAITVKKSMGTASFRTIKVPSGRSAASAIVRFGNKWVEIVSLHLSLNNDKLDDILAIENSILSGKSLLVGDFNILANDDEHNVFWYLKEVGYKKLNSVFGGFHGYGDSDKTSTTVDNFFTNFGELESLGVVPDLKASDHDLMWINIK